MVRGYVEHEDILEGVHAKLCICLYISQIES